MFSTIVMVETGTGITFARRMATPVTLPTVVLLGIRKKKTLIATSTEDRVRTATSFPAERSLLLCSIFYHSFAQICIKIKRIHIKLYFVPHIVKSKSAVFAAAGAAPPGILNMRVPAAKDRRDPMLIKKDAGPDTGPKGHRAAAAPNRSPAQRLRFGEEERRSE